MQKRNVVKNQKAKRPNVYLEAKGISKKFGEIQALDNVDFKVNSGEIVGLVGDNGAGKSTLVNILSGIIQPTEGKILMGGEEVVFNSSKDAMDYGIETISQDRNLIDDMSVMRNVFCGREEVASMGFMKLSKMREETMKVLEQDVTIEGIRSPNQMVRNLSGGQKQSVAIARALYFKKELLLLDEPTRALSVRETQTLLEKMEELQKQGISLVFVTHNIYHAYQVADRFVILRRGKKIRDVSRDETDIDDLIDVVSK